MMRSRTITVGIACGAGWAYDYLRDPRNLPAWAPGLCTSIERVGDEWIAATAQGPVAVRFVERNPFGVLDHHVRVSPGVEFLNPMRVVPNGDGCELMFTLFQAPDVTDEQFEADAALVTADLHRARTILESRG